MTAAKLIFLHPLWIYFKHDSLLDHKTHRLQKHLKPFIGSDYILETREIFLMRFFETTDTEMYLCETTVQSNYQSKQVGHS